MLKFDNFIFFHLNLCLNDFLFSFSSNRSWIRSRCGYRKKNEPSQNFPVFQFYQIFSRFFHNVSLTFSKFFKVRKCKCCGSLRNFPFLFLWISRIKKPFFIHVFYRHFFIILHIWRYINKRIIYLLFDVYLYWSIYLTKASFEKKNKTKQNKTRTHTQDIEKMLFSILGIY